LALVLLAGCGKDGGGVAEAGDMAYQAADIKRDSVLFTVDEAPVTAEEYLFWLLYAIDVQKASGALQDDSAWEETLDEDTPTADYLKQFAMDSIKRYRIVRTKAEEAGVVLSDEVREQLDQQLADAIDYVGGEEQFGLWLDEHCISKEGFMSLNEVYFLNEALAETMEGADEYLEEEGIYAAKHILLLTRRTKDDGTYEDFSDEEKAQVLEKIQGYREEIMAAADPAAKFDEIMNAHSEDGRNSAGDLYAPGGYTYVYPGEMVSAFEEGAKALEIGEISEPVQTPYGYHLILRTEADQAQAKMGLLDQRTDAWMDTAEVVTTKAYDEIDPKAFYDRLKKLVEAKRAALEAAQESEAPAGEESQAPEESAPAATPVG